MQRKSNGKQWKGEDERRIARELHGIATRGDGEALRGVVQIRNGKDKKSSGRSGKEMNWFDYGKQLKSIRRSKNITQERLARKIYTDQTSIYQYEHGKRRIDLETAIKLAKVLDVPVDELYDVQSLGVRIDWDRSSDENKYGPELINTATAYLEQIIRMKSRNH